MVDIHDCALRDLHPTQITVGLIEVSDKCIAFASMKNNERREFLRAHVIPAVRGPDRKLYITDHHHLALAAWYVCADGAFFAIEDDLSSLNSDQFWQKMIHNHWAHPFDARGHECPPEDIPNHVSGLRDDVYRSLAAYVRRAGGFDKTPTAFAEFLWADFFRAHLVIGSTREDFDRTVTRGLLLAHDRKARDLPGFRGAP